MSVQDLPGGEEDMQARILLRKGEDSKGGLGAPRAAAIGMRHSGQEQSEMQRVGVRPRSEALPWASLPICEIHMARAHERVVQWRACG